MTEHMIPPTATGPSSFLVVPRRWAVVLTVVFVISITLPAVTFFDTPAAYVPLHLVLEFGSMAISVMVFALAWNLRRLDNNSQIMIVGLFSLTILLIDLAHALSYPGMPDFVTESGTEKAINFWLTGRLVAAVGLVALALVPPRHWSRAAWSSGRCPRVLAACTIWWIGLYRPESLPRTFVTGEGLTAFKRASEYALATTYALAAVLLLLRARTRERSAEMCWLAASAWTLTLAELYFTLYGNVTDTFNLMGHVFKVIAYLMVYRAGDTFVAGVQEPYVSSPGRRPGCARSSTPFPT